jgi:hypothetical protein
MLSVVMMTVFMLSVMAPNQNNYIKRKTFQRKLGGEGKNGATKLNKMTLSIMTFSETDVIKLFCLYFIIS